MNEFNEDVEIDVFDEGESDGVVHEDPEEERELEVSRAKVVSSGYDEEPKKPFENVLEWTSCFVYAVALVLALNLFVFRSITVAGNSMNDTLVDKDKVVATNFAYTPKYGDIVIVEADKLHMHGTTIYGETIIKRVIATEGDTIRIDFEKGEVYRNGELLAEDYIKEPIHDHYPGWMASNEDYFVPKNCVFVMGDNRNASNDSRNMAEVGFIDVNYVMGKAFVRYAPFKSFKWL
ncbi:MAG: signal peptidase I [Oscillospiraceae bacterium]|nr:signal peptidase I [Oscillospiraceae bacterium]